MGLRKRYSDFHDQTSGDVPAAALSIHDSTLSAADLLPVRPSAEGPTHDGQPWVQEHLPMCVSAASALPVLDNSLVGHFTYFSGISNSCVVIVISFPGSSVLTKIYRESPSLLWNIVLRCSSRLFIISFILSLTADESLFLLKISKAHLESLHDK